MNISPKVLIVEDEWLIAEDLRERLSSLGATVMEPAATSSEALLAISSQTPDIAYVDTRLGSDTSHRVIEECDRRGVVVVISSGHFVEELPDYLQGRLLLSKPFHDDMVVASFQAALRTSSMR